MPVLARRLEEYQPQPDPVQQEMAKVELQLKQLELEEKQAKALKDRSQAQLNMAKAKESESAMDKSDLDFVEQESGVTQERELQKHGAQARANIDLENVKQRNATFTPTAATRQ